MARPPGLWSDAWTCPDHGAVAPLRAPVVPSDDALRRIAARSAVPVWLPYPPPPGWLVTGLRWAGSDRTGPVASVVACSGPHPLPLPVRDGGDVPRCADLLVVAEEPGVGLGAHLAGLSGVDAGELLGDGPPDARLRAAGHDVPLWWLSGPQAAVLVGEAAGVWLWMLIWPDDAAAVLLEDFGLSDARRMEHEPMLGYGALSPLMDDRAPRGARP